MPEKMGGYDRNGWVVFTGISSRKQRLYDDVLGRFIIAAEEIVPASEGNRLVATLQPKMLFYGRIFI